MEAEFFSARVGLGLEEIVNILDIFVVTPGFKSLLGPQVRFSEPGLGHKQQKRVKNKGQTVAEMFLPGGGGVLTHGGGHAYSKTYNLGDP